MASSSDLAGQYGHSKGIILQQTVPLDHKESLKLPRAQVILKGKDITKQGMIEALSQGTRDCVADIRKAGLPFFDIDVLDDQHCLTL